MLHLEFPSPRYHLALVRSGLRSDLLALGVKYTAHINRGPAEAFIAQIPMYENWDLKLFGTNISITPLLPEDEKPYAQLMDGLPDRGIEEQFDPDRTIITLSLEKNKR